jgi:hypothetical protein
MIDMELFELMKVTLKEVLRAKLRGSPDKWAQPVPSEVAARAFDLALAAKQRLEQHRPSTPIHDPSLPTLRPPGVERCGMFGCGDAPLAGSDYCFKHQG